jgi:cell division protein FtsN
MRESHEKALAELGGRLARLEQGQAPVTAKAEPVPAKPATKSRPLVSRPKATAPTAATGGDWVINLLSLSSKKTAQREQARLSQLGLEVDMQVVEKGGKRWYRLQVPGFDSYADAHAAIKGVQSKAGTKSAWVGSK